jgi:acetoin utilization deacetylase AcuC-like enzyme
MKIIYDEACAKYANPGHPERPERVIGTSARLREQADLPLGWIRPAPCPDEAVLRAHNPDLLDRLKMPHDLDPDTPWHEGILDYARASAGAALAGLETALTGENAFSLMRPPGHHATRGRAMGFCYLNNVAIAALEAVARGKRVAIFDFDVHHGNGTEAILLDVPGTVFCSVHQFPCYPGTGTRNLGQNCYNYPVPPLTPRQEYRHILSDAVDHVRQPAPDLLIVSAGFDSYARDPLSQETLEAEDFHWLGKLLRTLNVPILSALEGGYSTDLPELVMAYLRGVEGREMEVGPTYG